MGRLVLQLAAAVLLGCSVAVEAFPLSGPPLARISWRGASHPRSWRELCSPVQGSCRCTDAPAKVATRRRQLLVSRAKEEGDEAEEDSSQGGSLAFSGKPSWFTKNRPNLGIAREGTFLLLSALIGALTGACVTLFKLATGLVKGAMYGDFVGLFPVTFSQAVVAAVPILGGLAVVAIRTALPKRDFGPGLGGLIEEVDNGVPFQPLRAMGKALGAITTLGTGNSLGPEGPAVELGVACSRLVCAWKDLSIERQRTLLGAGAAAGVAAGFNAPIAGVFFSLEIVGDSLADAGATLSKSGIASTLLCAALSALVARLGLHEEYSLRPAPYNLASPLVELPLYLGLGFFSGLVACMFKYFMTRSRDAFQGSARGFGWMAAAPAWVKPLIGAAFTGLVGIFFPQILFFGYDTLDNLLANTGRYGTVQLLLLCVVKALTTAVCFGSGLVGGTFAPSLFLGATAGAYYQRAVVGLVSLASANHIVAPLAQLAAPGSTFEGVLQVAAAPAYSMVGAAAVLAAVYRAPLTSSLLLFELTRDYDIILPLMASAGVASLLVELVQSRATTALPAVAAAAAAAGAAGEPAEEPSPLPSPSLTLAEQLPQVSVPAGYMEMGLSAAAKRQAVMATLAVRDALEPEVLLMSARTPLGVAAAHFQHHRCDVAVVLADDGGAAGGAAFDVGASELRPGEFSTPDALESVGGARIVGVASVRDVIRAVEGDSAAARAAVIGDVCSRDYLAIASRAPLLAAADLLESSGVKHLPALEGVGAANGEAVRRYSGGTPVPCVGMVSVESLRVAVQLRETALLLERAAESEAEAAAAAAVAAAAQPGGGLSA